MPDNDPGVKYLSNLQYVGLPEFARGFRERLHGERPEYEHDNWDYERGRQFANWLLSEQRPIPPLGTKAAALLFNEARDAGGVL
jgi:hypothetical protein